jgi:hypothetical protein
MSVVEEIRKSRDEWETYQNEYGDFAQIEKLPVRQWNRFKYIFTGKIDLREGKQDLPVIDITNCFDEVALFANTYPECTKREYAVVIFPLEGDIRVLMENGGEPRFQLRTLTVRVELATMQDYQEMDNEELDDFMYSNIDSQF